MDFKLKTDDLSPGLGRDFRDDLIDNFTNTQEAINKIINRLDSNDTSDFVRKEDLESMLHKLRDKIDDDNKELKERINRILLGTDVESIEIVVTQILKQRGVID
ncbi:hypothetical protein JIO05_05530 [Pediococcus acidilactici]|jgi:transcription termination factor NusB|uniref:hypothetical protein n=1 Tax=Pediococcus acidilactici TaxID=1254 RepID=UPI000FE3F653|nr:hypothetical protein [Pediococcus acidilactici]KAF0373153.1 hypothetical protein GBO58_02665 [Pediococcus acidilactici]KAF0383655.1 hypothetical protein GBO62_02585 [Pediococcus acidilactici]KAF0457641.1 hypothetical protein GBP02_02585 [Pediococcus acidilactici]KAF0476925.1 hypothetical protein GBP10_02875 [Pediococcus acidilactici]KAF0537451.1 hypothetical protein GBP37_02885 [Pediococcus acidilactici]